MTSPRERSVLSIWRRLKPAVRCPYYLASGCKWTSRGSGKTIDQHVISEHPDLRSKIGL